MKIETIITCVNYADFLSITLPVTREYFESITVITAPDDQETMEIARHHKAVLHITDIWHKDGSAFNKAGALNECLAQFQNKDDDHWILFLDADILLIESIISEIPNLDPRGLYSIRRRMCETKQQWNGFTAKHLKLSDFPIDEPHIENGKVWGNCPTANPAGLFGYFQLWNLNCGAGKKILPESFNAAWYDTAFALTFPEELRGYIKNKEALHLGLSYKNWSGRVSERWVT